MISKKYQKFIFNGLSAASLFLFFSSLAQAAISNDLYQQMDAAGTKAWGGPPTFGSSGVADIIQYVIEGFLSLLGIIFILLIIYAGFNWMTARGDEEKVTKAKDTLTRALIGLIIIIAAYSITYFVFNALPGGGGNPLGGSP